MRYWRGQITITNLLVLVMVELAFLIMLPVINQQISERVVEVQTAALENNQSDMQILFLQLFPVFLQLAILITAIMYALPRRES